MADSFVATGLTVEQWDDKFFTEYLTENRFAGKWAPMRLHHSGEGKPDQEAWRPHQLCARQQADQRRDYRPQYAGRQRRGYVLPAPYELVVDKRRNGVRIAEVDEQFSAISLREAAKSVLKDWSHEGHRDADHSGARVHQRRQLRRPSDARRRMPGWSTMPTASCSASQRLYRRVHATGLLLLDLTDDKLTALAVSR